MSEENKTPEENAVTEQNSAENNNGGANNANNNNGAGNNGGKNFNDFLNTKDTTDEFDKDDIEKNKLMAILAYLSWLVLIPLFAAKDSKYARFHCNQGIILAITEIVLGVVLGVLTRIPYIWWIFSILGSLLGLCCLALAIIGIINVANGKAKELPIVGGFKILK